MNVDTIAAAFRRKNTRPNLPQSIRGLWKADLFLGSQTPDHWMVASQVPGGIARDRLGLTRALSQGLSAVRERRGKHDPGRVVRDLAVMVAGGGDCLSDLRAVRDQEPLFGEVASNATAFRVIDRIAGDPGLLEALRAARARARENAWRAPGERVRRQRGS